MKEFRIALILVVALLATVVLVGARQNDEHRQVAVCAYELKKLGGAETVDLNDVMQFCQKQYKTPSLDGVLAKFALLLLLFNSLLNSNLIRDSRLLLKTFIDTGKIDWRQQ